MVCCISYDNNSMFFSIMVYTGNIRASETAKTKLIEAVIDASEEINSVGESFIIDDDISFYEDGVYISVYDETSELIEGRRPAEIADLPALKDKYMKKVIDSENTVWYMYDSRFNMNGKSVWVRGIVKDFAEESTFTFMLRIAAVAFPVLIILAAIGGYIITRRAFSPIRKIIETAESISRDGDLSKRIEIEQKRSGRKGAKDEIYNLSMTFNSMFDKLQGSFEKEKRFTSDVSHELRTPLTVIISQSEYAMEDKEYERKALEVINAEAKRMSGLVNRLLTIARSDSGRLKIQNKKLDFSNTCSMVVQQQEAIAEERGIKTEVDIQPGIYVCGDETMLIQILLNLIDNSIKYSRKNGHIYITMCRETRKDRRAKRTEHEYAKVSVKDDGIGISEENLDKIWERFYRADSSRSCEGSGLGLSMVKALVDAHDGFIEVKSVLGEGSIFDVYIPVLKDDNKSESEDLRKQ